MTMVDSLPYLPTGETALKEQKDRRLTHGRERLRGCALDSPGKVIVELACQEQDG